MRGRHWLSETTACSKVFNEVWATRSRSCAAAAASPRPTSGRASRRSARRCSTPTSTSTSSQTFIERVTQRSVGQEVLRTIDPSEQIVKIVYDELVALMGPVDTRIRFAKDRPTVLMLCGLQGQGKTTTAGKLALTLREQGRKPLLVAADLQRPAAVEQLKVLGEQINVPVFSEFPSDPVDVCRNAVAYAKKNLLDTVILDTAGRLHVDEMPMDELKQIDRRSSPTRSTSSATP